MSTALLVVSGINSWVLSASGIYVRATTSCLISTQLKGRNLTRAYRRQPRRRSKATRTKAFFRRHIAFRVNRVGINDLGTMDIGTFFECTSSRVPRRLSGIISIRCIQSVIRDRLFNDRRYNTSGLRRLIFYSLKMGIAKGSISSFSCG